MAKSGMKSLKDVFGKEMIYSKRLAIDGEN